MKNTDINRQIIKRVATALEELNEEVLYVGGAAVTLYVNDPAAEDVRPTKDIDISIKIVSLTHLEEIREKLIEKGFKQSSDLDVICRFKLDDILVDVMGTEPIGWAPANIWFKAGFQNVEQIEIENTTINIMPLPYFLASKFVAHNDRGGSDPRFSHDFEDIVYLLDNRTDWNDIILNAEQQVKDYLIHELIQIKTNTRLQEAVLGNLFYETQEVRFNKIMLKIDSLS